MLKPDWKNAPAWAAWLAMDSDGTWMWYENRPREGISVWDVLPGDSIKIAEDEHSWRDTLEQRPDYQQRVRTEAAELETRIEALTAFLVTPAYHAIDKYDAALLRNQQRHMQAYLDVLRIRIARFK